VVLFKKITTNVHELNPDKSGQAGLYKANQNSWIIQSESKFF